MKNAINQWIKLLNNQTREALRYSYVMDGTQYTTNSHVLFAMNKDNYLTIDSLPDGLSYPASCKSFIPESNWGQLNELDFNLINDPVKLKEDQRKSKTNPAIYKLKDTFDYSVTINNDYLKMVLGILGKDTKCYATGNTRPVLFESPKGKAIIMPMLQH